MKRLRSARRARARRPTRVGPPDKKSAGPTTSATRPPAQARRWPIATMRTVGQTRPPWAAPARKLGTISCSRGEPSRVSPRLLLCARARARARAVSRGQMDAGASGFAGSERPIVRIEGFLTSKERPSARDGRAILRMEGFLTLRERPSVRDGRPISRMEGFLTMRERSSARDGRVIPRMEGFLTMRERPSVRDGRPISRMEGFLTMRNGSLDVRRGSPTTRARRYSPRVRALTRNRHRPADFHV